MREIKFRAWDGQEMIQAIYPKSNFKFEIDWDGKFKLFKFDNRYPVFFEDGEETMMPDWEEVSEAVIMQYTGLKDKNSKGIYEGDVVHANDPFEGGSGEVKFQYGSYYIDFGALDAVNLDSYEEEDLEVIGNIYENPGLIK